MSSSPKLSSSELFKYLELVAPYLPAPIYWEDLHGRVLGLNQEALDSTGTSQEVIGQTLYDFYPYEIAHPIVVHNEEVVKTGAVLAQEERLDDLVTGESKWFISRKAPLRDPDGAVMGMIGASIDITAQKNIERQLHIEKKKAALTANLAKSDFMSSISHEFRTPLNAMMGMTQLLLMNAPNDNAKGKLDEIMRAGSHLLGLITDILDFSKLEAEKYELHQKPFSLSNLFNQSVNQFQQLLEGQNEVFLDSYCDPDLPEFIVGDEKCLKQILNNFGSNAIKFTKSGSVTANLFLMDKDSDKIKLRIELIDTGKGIPKKKLSLIFDRFTQADSSYKRQYGGAGLGLAIAKKLIDQMGGSVGVDSTLGQGSCFWCELDLTIATDEQVEEVLLAKKAMWSCPLTKENYPSMPQVASLSSLLVQKKVAVSDCSNEILLNKQVIMIEDDHLNQMVLNGMLERLGGQAMVFSDAQSALDHLEKNAPTVDLILTDIGLPGMNGQELMIKIRQNTRYKNCPMVAVTGFSGRDERQQFLKDGADAVLTKPVSFVDLKALLHQYLAEPQNI